MSLGMVDVSVPAETVALVLIEHGDDGELLARYAESRERVPAPKRQVALALLQLAAVLIEQADDLDSETPTPTENGHDHD